MFKLKMIDRTGTPSELYYNQHTSRLTDKNGFSAVDFNKHYLLDRFIKTKPENFIAVSPENPGKKIKAIKKLKIQLGLGCNYSCGYCLQRAEIHVATASSTRDAQLFVDNIHTWLTDPNTVEKVELWGGEPMLYWKKVETMMPKLKELFPKAQFGMVTNGTLFTKEIIDQLKEWDFNVSMSHDGPGYHVRGEDPLDDFEKYLLVEYAMNTLGNKFSFNCVLTPINHDVSKIINWFEDKFNNPRVNFEGVAHDYSENNDPSSVFTKEQLHIFTIDLATKLIGGISNKSPGLNRKLKEAMKAIVNQRPSAVLYQKCGMDSPDQLAVDLRGKVTTCQNVGAEGPHKIGDVRKFDDIKLNTSTHWSKRKECVACPVLQLCQGSCMYQTGSGWVNSCNAEFSYNLAFFIAALFFLTGKRLIGFEGDIIRPEMPNAATPA